MVWHRIGDKHYSSMHIWLILLWRTVFMFHSWPSSIKGSTTHHQRIPSQKPSHVTRQIPFLCLTWCFRCMVDWHTWHRYNVSGMSHWNGESRVTLTRISIKSLRHWCEKTSPGMPVSLMEVFLLLLAFAERYLSSPFAEATPDGRVRTLERHHTAPTSL